jgi:hypothetical protein
MEKGILKDLQDAFFFLVPLLQVSCCILQATFIISMSLTIS